VIVLDAAALVDVVVDQPAKTWVLGQLRGVTVCAPAHQPAEVLAALARLRREGRIGDAVTREALREALALEQELVSPTYAQVERALELHGRIRVLDGLYVALAQERGCPLVTTDKRLGGADAPCEIRVP
jgi:predicted nucleic acid-binding protein